MSRTSGATGGFAHTLGPRGDPVRNRGAIDPETGLTIEQELIQNGAGSMPQTRARAARAATPSGGAPEVADRDLYVDNGDSLVRYNEGDRLAAEHVGLPTRTVE